MAKILVVDDETHITHVVALKLRNAGYEVDTAGDGEEGYELASMNGYDLIITDIQMPYMTGLELAEKLYNNSKTKKTPIIVLTARGYKLDPTALGDSAIREILSKPFSPREVLAHVERILGNVRKDAA